MTVPRPIKQANRGDLLKEYVSGGEGNFAAYGSYKQTALPWNVDDLTGQLGIDIYEKMMLDGQVSACMTVFKASVVEEGLHITPCITDDSADGYEISKEISEAFERTITKMETDFDNFLWNMLDACIVGNKVAEQTYDYAAGFLDLCYLKVKPRQSVAFVVDQYLNVIGIAADTDGVGVQAVALDATRLLPRDKFAILSWRMKDEDPRGTSMLRPAYEPWWVKRQMKPEYLKYLAQFAGPSIWGTTHEGATLENVDPDDPDPPTSPEQVLLRSMVQWKNASALALPFGSKIQALVVEGGDKAFLSCFAMSNLEITKSILTQQLATEESEFMARAAAQVHQDVLDTLIRQGKRSVVRMILHDIVKPWVEYNWGPAAVEYLPKLSLGQVEHTDLAPLMNAIANLRRSNYLSDDQLAYVDIILGLPQRKEPPPPVLAQQAAVPATDPATGDEPASNDDGTPKEAE